MWQQHAHAPPYGSLKLACNFWPCLRAVFTQLKTSHLQTLTLAADSPVRPDASARL